MRNFIIPHIRNLSSANFGIMITNMIKTSLDVVKVKLGNMTGKALATAVNARPAAISEFSNAKRRRINLDLIQNIIDYAASVGVTLTISDFFTDSD